MIGLIFATCVAAHDCKYEIADVFDTMKQCKTVAEQFAREEQIDPKRLICDEVKVVRPKKDERSIERP